MLTVLIRSALALLLALPLMLSSPLLQADTLRLATTANSGLLDAILPEFERLSGTQVQVIAVGTGAALRLGRDGDVLLVHAPSAEQAFIDRGYGEHRTGVMYNDFVLVGPSSDPAGIKGQQDAVAFAQLRSTPNGRGRMDAQERSITYRVAVGPCQ